MIREVDVDDYKDLKFFLFIVVMCALIALIVAICGNLAFVHERGNTEKLQKELDRVGALLRGNQEALAACDARAEVLERTHHTDTAITISSGSSLTISSDVLNIPKSSTPSIIFQARN